MGDAHIEDFVKTGWIGSTLLSLYFW